MIENMATKLKNRKKLPEPVEKSSEESEDELTQEQLERIEKNRKRALQIKEHKQNHAKL